MKTAKSATFTMRIVAALVSAVMLLCFLPALLAGVTASAEGETDDTSNLLQLQEVDAMATDGYKIEKQSGVYTDPTDNSEHPYDYVMTVSDEIWFVSGTLNINNVASRPFIFNVMMPDGKPVSGTEFFDHGSWWNFTSTDDVIAELDRESFREGTRENIIYLLTGNTPGETVLTATLSATPNEDNVLDPGGEDYTAGVPLNATLRILYKCVTVENTDFTFTGVSSSLNNNDSAYNAWFYGVNIPEASAEWTRAERFIGNGQSNFLNNIYFLEGDSNGDPVEPTEENLAGNDFTNILADKTSGAPMFQIEIRDDHMELLKEVRTGDNLSDEPGEPVNYEAGDAFYLKAGLYYLGKDGNGTWGYQEYGFSYFELSRDQYFVYDGETWSADELGVSITFAENTAGVDVGETVTLTPNITYGSAVDESMRTVTWTSNNDEIATVDQNGVVTGVAEGSAVITATTGTGDYATVTVSVVPSTSITSIRLNTATINLNIGGTRQVSATVEGGSAADKTVTWSSSDTSVATVDQNGLVTAVAAGSCTITATASDGKTATANVTVREGAVDEPEDPADPGDDTEPENPADTEEGGGCSGSIVSGTLALGGVLIAGAVCAVISLRRKNRE